jgi:hypothetical protein
MRVIYLTLSQIDSARALSTAQLGRNIVTHGPFTARINGPPVSRPYRSSSQYSCARGQPRSRIQRH